MFAMGLPTLIDFLKKINKKKNGLFRIFVANRHNECFDASSTEETRTDPESGTEINFMYPDNKNYCDRFLHGYSTCRTALDALVWSDQHLAKNYYLTSEIAEFTHLHIVTIEGNLAAIDEIMKPILQTLDEECLYDKNGCSLHHYTTDGLAIFRTTNHADKLTVMRIFFTTELYRSDDRVDLFSAILKDGRGFTEVSLQGSIEDRRYLNYAFSLLKEKCDKNSKFIDHFFAFLMKSSIIFHCDIWKFFLLPFVENLDGHYLFVILKIIDESSGLNFFQTVFQSLCPYVHIEGDDLSSEKLLFCKELLDLMVKERNDLNMIELVDLLTFCKEGNFRGFLRKPFDLLWSNVLADEKKMQLLSICDKDNNNILHHAIEWEEELFSFVWQILMKLSEAGDHFKEQIYQLICTNSTRLGGTILQKVIRPRSRDFYNDVRDGILKFICQFDYQRQLYFLTLKDENGKTALRLALQDRIQNERLIAFIVELVLQLPIEEQREFLTLEIESLEFAGLL